MLIKVCCIQNEAELGIAVRAGATHVGLVGEMPSGPGPIPDEEISRIASGAPPGIMTVLLTARVDAVAIVDHVRAAGTSAVQLVQRVAPDVRIAIRDLLPGIEIVQVVHVEGRASTEVAREAAVGADYLLMDSGLPSADTPELGGTGRTHDWSVSAEIVARSPVPVFLAGGLHATNVREAIEIVRPAGVDVCSGLRDRAGRLVLDSLTGFVQSVRDA